MKALFFLHSLANFAGIERVMCDKMNYMAQQGHDVTLVTYEQGKHPYSFPLNNPIHCINIENCRFFTLYRYHHPIRLWKMMKMKRLFKQKFHRLVVDVRPDVIITVSNAGDFMNEVMTAPYGRKIVEAHGAYPAIMASNTILGRCKNYLYRQAIRKTDMMITLTNSDKYYWDKIVKKVLVVPNPITFYCDTVNGIERKKGRILCVARLEPQKRIDRLIIAFNLIATKFPEWYVDVFGAGVEQDNFRNMINSLGLPNRIHLNQPTTDIKKEYQTSQMLVLSSDYEGFPLVLLEAMACGLPCVSTRCPFGPSEIIEDGYTGLLCDLNSNDLAAKMEWMITHETERKQMGIKAHDAAAKYRKDVVMKMWEKAYEEAYENAEFY